MEPSVVCMHCSAKIAQDASFYSLKGELLCKPCFDKDQLQPDLEKVRAADAERAKGRRAFRTFGSVLMTIGGLCLGGAMIAGFSGSPEGLIGLALLGFVVFLRGFLTYRRNIDPDPESCTSGDPKPW